LGQKAKYARHELTDNNRLTTLENT